MRSQHDGHAVRQATTTLHDGLDSHKTGDIVCTRKGTMETHVAHLTKNDNYARGLRQVDQTLVGKVPSEARRRCTNLPWAMVTSTAVDGRTKYQRLSNH